MADENDISKIISNYKSMSMGDLANNLLSRQDRISKTNKRKAHRADKVNTILGVLLGTQAVFNKNAQTRLAEIDTLDLALRKKNKKFLSELNVVGRTLRDIPIEIINSATPYKDFKAPKNEKVLVASRANLRRFIGDRIKQEDPKGYEEAVNGNTLQTQVDHIHDTLVMPHFLEMKDGKKSPAQRLLQEGEKYFEGTVEADDVFEKLFGLELSDIEDRQTERLSNAKRNIRQRSSLLGVPSVIKGIFKGDKSIFRAMETGDWSGSTLAKHLEDDVELGDFITPDFTGVMGAWTNSTNYRNRALGNESLMDTTEGGRSAKALDNFINKQYKKLEEGPVELNTNQNLLAWKTERFKSIEEARALRTSLYNETGTASEYDRDLARGLQTTWGGLRLMLDDTGRQGYRILEKEFNVNLAELNIEEKDELAMRIVLAKSLALDDPSGYGGGMFKKEMPNYEQGIEGTIELYSPDAPRTAIFDDTPVGTGKVFRRESRDEKRSNFRSSFNAIDTFLVGNIDGIDDEGLIKLSKEAEAALADDNTDTQKTVLKEINKDIQRIQDYVGEEAAENVQLALMQNPSYASAYNYVTTFSGGRNTTSQFQDASTYVPSNAESPMAAANPFAVPNMMQEDDEEL